MRPRLRHRDLDHGALPMRRSVATELGCMAAAVTLAGITVFATLGSARSGDLVFCQLVDGDVVVGVTTDCSEAVEIEVVDLWPLPVEIDLCADGFAIVVLYPDDDSTRAAAHGPTVIRTGCPVDGGSVPDAFPSLASAADPSLLVYD